VDPETRAEFEEMQKKSPLNSAANPATQIQNFDFASWMAGKTSSGEESSSQGQGQGGQAKRRG
jgi:ER membrane protein complex subunit 7